MNDLSQQDLKVCKVDGVFFNLANERKKEEEEEYPGDFGRRRLLKGSRVRLV